MKGTVRGCNKVRLDNYSHLRIALFSKNEDIWVLFWLFSPRSGDIWAFSVSDWLQQCWVTHSWIGDARATKELYPIFTVYFPCVACQSLYHNTHTHTRTQIYMWELTSACRLAVFGEVCGGLRTHSEGWSRPLPLFTRAKIAHDVTMMCSCTFTSAANENRSSKYTHRGHFQKHTIQ